MAEDMTMAEALDWHREKTQRGVVRRQARGLVGPQILTPRIHRYNVGKALREQERRQLTGLEREVRDELERVGENPRHDGVIVPWPVVSYRATSGIDVSDDAEAASLVKGIRVAPWADLGRASIGVLDSALTIEGLVGDLILPSLSTDAEPEVVAEGGTPTEASIAFTGTTLEPHELRLDQLVSRRALQNTSLDMILAKLLARQFASRIRALTIAGTGTPPEPAGIISLLTPTAAASMDWSDVCGLMETVEGADVSDDLAFLAPAAVVTLLNTRPKTSSGTDVIRAGDGTILGRTVDPSSAMPAAHLLYGDFSQVLIAIWGRGLELVWNPYLESKKGASWIHGYCEFDCAPMQLGAFAALDSIT